ncbi:hypothetical protein M413DRAFT_376539 [Hebeloma cylindrosporum]|uniref:BTB domain-containing protein n=1 Tax=Hebeloma cylindrosporum TaxID=76867 RepID=A0A0C2YT77_HEBCY|nr:hypothetical protein M413DRAFT_376539 [Hebeloma cylindrosporum h7]
MSENPPLKRQRTDDAQCASETQPLQRSRFWFDDGNVILQAENTQFRVHRSVLSLYSNIFKAMFSVPHPTGTTTMPNVDGCPVIALPDNASDLEHVLSIFYGNIRSYDMRKRMPMDLLTAILRFGKKYEIDHLCKEGLERLPFDFANTLQKWDMSFDEDPQTDYSLQVHNVLQLGCELSILSCLPTAYLMFVAHSNLDTIMKRSTDYGGAMDRQIISRSVLGRDKLIQAYLEVLKGWAQERLLTPSQQCSSTSFCSHKKLLASQSLFSTGDGKISLLEPWRVVETSNFLLCEPCLESLRVPYQKARQGLWADLPSFFGLPPWEELKDFDA